MNLPSESSFFISYFNLNVFLFLLRPPKHKTFNSPLKYVDIFLSVPNTDCYQSREPQCSLERRPVGCFQDKKDPSQRALPELLLTARDPGSKVYFGEPINWTDWANFIDR